MQITYLVQHITELIVKARKRREIFKCVVFSQWSRFLDLVKIALDATNIQYAVMYGASELREAALDRFRNQSDVPVLLVNMRSTQHSGAAGLQLTEASHAFLMEPCLNFGLEQQAIGRISRIGQTRPATVIRLVCNDTIEESIIEMASRKRLLHRDDSEEGDMKANEIVKMFNLLHDVCN